MTPTLYVNKEDCTGCSACSQICALGAIDMLPDEEGFLYPRINQEICVECLRCEKCCPLKQVANKR